MRETLTIVLPLACDTWYSRELVRNGNDPITLDGDFLNFIKDLAHGSRHQHEAKEARECQVPLWRLRAISRRDIQHQGDARWGDDNRSIFNEDARSHECPSIRRVDPWTQVGHYQDRRDVGA